MPRYTNKVRSHVETQEGALGCLASAILLLELVDLRVMQAQSIQPSLLSPAIDDLFKAKELIRESQGYVVLTLPSSRPMEG
jgi:hypothetical protein